MIEKPYCTHLSRFWFASSGFMFSLVAVGRVALLSLSAILTKISIFYSEFNKGLQDQQKWRAIWNGHQQLSCHQQSARWSGVMPNLGLLACQHYLTEAYHKRGVWETIAWKISIHIFSLISRWFSICVLCADIKHINMLGLIVILFADICESV